jgi:hypothetical protein
MVKSDFLQNIAARGLDSFAIQGYVALKNMPDTPLAKAVALSTRLFNRIGNAGRFHLGLSCRLLDSGWAIKQEVLEMIPYHRGMDLDNLEYTLRLNLENFRVSWAPNVVVYSDAQVDFLKYLTRCVGTLWNRLHLLGQYGPRLLGQVVLHFDWNELEQGLAILTPPFLLTCLSLTVLTILSAQPALRIPGSPLLWGIAATLTMVLHVLAVVVARGKLSDYTAMLFYTPFSYALALAASPVAVYRALQDAWLARPQAGSNYRKVRTTRFSEKNQDLGGTTDDTWLAAQQGKHALQDHLQAELAETTSRRPAKKKGASVESLQTASRKPSGDEPMPAVGGENSALAGKRQQAFEVVRSVPLSNGVKSVNCRLKTLTTYSADGRENYQLTLEYNRVSFSTEAYRILDQAFYELHAKLRGRGLTMVTCGSCGNFYNPTADVPDTIRGSGVCLFDKQGKEVSLKTDAVTVVSQACNYHCPLEQREGIVREWKESLSLSRSR